MTSMTRTKNRIIAMATTEGRDDLKAYCASLTPTKDMQRYIEELIFKDSKVDIARKTSADLSDEGKK